MKKIWGFLFLPLLLGAGEINVLETINGSAKLMEGASGSWERSGSTVKFTKTSDAGYIIFAGNSKVINWAKSEKA